MFYNARWYDTYLNRWVQPDSIIPDPYNPQDYDRFAYVRNNPINFNDPTGHLSEDEIMETFGVTEWDQVIAVFEKGGALEGQWGWLATLRKAEIGDEIQFMGNFDSLWKPYVYATVLSSGVLAKDENGKFFLSTTQGTISLIEAGNTPCDGFAVIGHREIGLYAPYIEEYYKGGYEAKRAIPHIRHDPNKVDLVSAGLDATSVVASLVGANPATNGAKIANKVGQASAGTSVLKSLFVDQTPNSLILSGGGLIPGPIGGGFSLASLFYDLGFYFSN